MKVIILFVICQTLCTVCIHDSFPLEVENKSGGKYHLLLNTSLRLIVNKYREGIVKRTLKRKLNSA